MITRISTSSMTKEQWNAERLKSIGGSDAAALLGLNPYKSAFALWAEKTGEIKPEDISDREAVRLGHDLEDYVAKRFAEATGKKVRRENFFIYNSDFPIAHALPDRMVVGEAAGLECKTTSSWERLKLCRDGEYPKDWYCQCVHYMMVTGAQKWYLAVLCFGHGFYHFTIERDEERSAPWRTLSAIFGSTSRTGSLSPWTDRRPRQRRSTPFGRTAATARAWICRAFPPHCRSIPTGKTAQTRRSSGRTRPPRRSRAT